MNNEFKKNQKIKEFQSLIANYKYDGVAQKLIEEVYAHQIDIGFFDIAYSKTQTSEYGCYLCIKKKPQFGNTAELIFDIMHELGHCLDDIKLQKKDEYNIELRREREIRAWHIADNKFESYPELKEIASNYAAYKDKCLASYWAD